MRGIDAEAHAERSKYPSILQHGPKSEQDRYKWPFPPLHHRSRLTVPITFLEEKVVKGCIRQGVCRYSPNLSGMKGIFYRIRGVHDIRYNGPNE